MSGTRPTTTARTIGRKETLPAYLDAELTVPNEPKAVQALVDYFWKGSGRTKAEVQGILAEAARTGKPVSLSKLLPAYVVENLGTTENGPNCFNAVVNFDKSRQGLAVKNVMTGDAELVAHVEGNMTLLDPKAALKPGDALLFWHRPMEKKEETDMAWAKDLVGTVKKEWFERDVFLDHAAIYIGGGLFFHKGAKGAQFPWVIVDAKSLTADYRDNIVTTHRPR